MASDPDRSEGPRASPPEHGRRTTNARTPSCPTSRNAIPECSPPTEGQQRRRNHPADGRKHWRVPAEEGEHPAGVEPTRRAQRKPQTHHPRPANQRRSGSRSQSQKPRRWRHQSDLGTASRKPPPREHLHQLNPDNIWLRLTPPAGDIAFRFLEYIRSQQERQQRRAMSLRQTPLWRDVSDRYPDGGGAPESAVVVCDINKEMLKVGRQRADSRGVTTGLSWVVGDAEELLFNDDQFDLYTIAFGIRNVTHIDQALKEALRVLKPGGRFLCLEFSKVTNPIFSLCSTAAAVLLFLQKMCSYSRHMLEGTYQFPTPEVQNSGVSLPLPW
uniref:2-methoxy-6-polyprenyl-1,4-benzoquinol methylase, mitochondrial n=1 Tax=Oryzias melastigma TaxID=30732 RepID=A0A3B3BPV7_ORYME